METELRKFLPESVSFLLKAIMDAGGKAYLVGGALRNMILDREIKDYDVATSLTPDKIESLFTEYKTYALGKRFGTITVVINNLAIEVTTFRGEAGYSDYRHPDHITFESDIYADLSRRDFTMNALAYNPFTDEGLIDPFSGILDMDRRIIRTVRCPDERFLEDPLRIMRAIRFAAQLGFSLDAATFAAVAKHHSLLAHISPERIRDEWLTALLAPHAGRGTQLMIETGILKQLLHYGGEACTLFCMRTNEYGFLEDCPALPSFRMSGLLHAVRGANFDAIQVEELLRQLRFDNKTIADIMMLLDALNRLVKTAITPCLIRRLLAAVGHERIHDLFTMYYAFRNHDDFNTHDTTLKYDRAVSILQEVIARQDPVQLSDLAVTGRDILELGIGADNRRLVGEALATAYEWMLQDPAVNNRETLLERLRSAYL